MKKIYFSFLCMAVAILLSSCAHSVYPLDFLYSNYDSRMRSPEDLAIKANVWIYFNEKDIPGEYSIISANTYSPFCFLPFQGIRVKKMNKRFLEQAVKQADKEGGNAVLVQGGGIFYVLNMKNRDGIEAPAANFINPILDMKNADIVKSGSVETMKRGERTRTIKAFMDEIESNIDYLQTAEEIAAVRKKIEVLSQYNLRVKNPMKSVDKFVRKKTSKVNSIEKKMAKQAAKQNKQPATSSSKKK